MTDLKELKSLATEVLSEISSYEERPTKACSLRIRKLTQRLNNIGPILRKELIAADKAGY